MNEERRKGHVDLEKAFQDHVGLSLQVQQKFQAHVDRFDQFEDSLLTVIAGPEDSLTGIREGGMRGDIGELKLAVKRMEYKESNGGVNAKIKFSLWQKTILASMPFITVGVFALLQAWIEKG